MELAHRFPNPEAVYDKEAFQEAFRRNYAGYQPLVECSRLNLQHRWNNRIVNPNWRCAERESAGSGKKIYDFRSNTQGEWNGIELRFSLGLYAIPQAYERAIQTMNDLGFNVVLSTLVMMDRHDTGIPEHYPDDIHTFYANRDLEIDRGHDHEEKLIIAVTHSTSGTGNLKNGSDPDKVRTYFRRGIIGALDVAPFCGMAGANWEFYPNYRRALAIQAAMTPHAKPCETLSGKAHKSYMKFLGEPQIYTSVGDPTFQQMVADMEVLADSTIDALEQMTPEQLRLPRVLIVPDLDSVACAPKGRKAGKLIGGHVHRTDAWHNPIVESPERSIKRMLKVVQTLCDANARYKLNKELKRLNLPLNTTSHRPPLTV